MQVQPRAQRLGSRNRRRGGGQSRAGAGRDLGLFAVLLAVIFHIPVAAVQRRELLLAVACALSHGMGSRVQAAGRSGGRAPRDPFVRGRAAAAAAPLAHLQRAAVTLEAGTQRPDSTARAAVAFSSTASGCGSTRNGCRLVQKSLLSLPFRKKKKTFPPTTSRRFGVCSGPAR